jgi:N-acetylneuraminic acid mutarotase
MHGLGFILVAVLIFYIVPTTFVTHIFPVQLPSQAVVAKSASSSLESTKTWTIGASSATPKMESAYASVGDKIYIIAGYGETGKRNKNSVEVYDSKSNTWAAAAPVPVNLNHAAGASYNGKIYVIGGYLDNKVPSNRLFIYDTSQNLWQEGKSMPTARAALTAQFVNGILYAVGGTTTGVLNINEAYDPVTNTWTEKAPMPTARQLLGDKTDVYTLRYRCHNGDLVVELREK